MAVATLTEFPASFIAGDTLRVSISDSSFLSTLWSLKALLTSATKVHSFTASAVAGGSFLLEISAANTAKLAPGIYAVRYVFTETSTTERKTGADSFITTVYANPEAVGAKSIARQTLEAMESAFLKLSGGSNLSVNFNGQSFTKRNLKDFMDAIDRQRAIVAAEDVQLTGQRSRGRILHPI